MQLAMADQQLHTTSLVVTGGQTSLRSIRCFAAEISQHTDYQIDLEEVRDNSDDNRMVVFEDIAPRMRLRWFPKQEDGVTKQRDGLSDFPGDPSLLVDDAPPPASEGLDSLHVALTDADVRLYETTFRELATSPELAAAILGDDEA